MINKEIPILDKGYVKLISFMGQDESPLSDARLSSQARPDVKRDDGLRSYLWEHGHTSTFQSMICQIELKLPLFVLHQLHRHRTVSFDGLEIESSEEGFRKWFSPNEQSGRYSKFEDEFYIPEKVLAQDTKNKQGSVDTLEPGIQEAFISRLDNDNADSYHSYITSIENGISKEYARLLLQPNLYTRRRITGDFVNWCNLEKLRLDPHAQPESRAYAQGISEILKFLWPKSYELFEEYTLHAVKFSKSEMFVLQQMAGFFNLENREDVKTLLGPKRFAALLDKLCPTT